MRKIVVILILFASLSVAGQVVNEDSRKALKETKEFLNNKSEVQKYIKEDKTGKAKKADDYANSVSGGDEKSKQEMYSIAADIMEVITEKTKGDPEAMQKLMLEAQTNPEKFYNSLTPEQKKRIKALGKKLAPVNAKNP